MDDLVEGKQDGFLEEEAFELSQEMERIVADGDGGSVGTECTKTRRQTGVRHVVENIQEPLLSNGRVYIRFRGTFNPGRFCFQGTLGDVWGSLSWSRPQDAIGKEWVEARDRGHKTGPHNKKDQ